LKIFANGDYTDGAHIRAMEGIAVPIEYNIPRQCHLFRFVDIGRGPHREVANRPWWFEFEYFKQIESFAQRHGYDLPHCARLFLAILHEYSEITGYVSAWTNLPLKAYKGRGKVVESTGKDARDPSRMIPMQSVNEVYQLYIPGLGRGLPVFDRAFTRLSYHRLT
jgi:hypothetical protein